MRVLLSGSTGFIGSALRAYLETGGHEVVPLLRPGSAAGALTRGFGVRWDPQRGEIDPLDLEGFEAVIHMAAESIVGRWTPAKKQRIRDSRVHPTRLLAEALARTQRRPPVLLAASAVGYYGGSSDAERDESSPPGHDFLAEACRDWEAAADPARQAGIRVVHARLSTVLGAAGGALQRLLPLFRLGLGGRLGSGRQYWSWISIDDVASAAEYCLLREDLAGPVNFTAPEPVTNRRFTQALAQALHRPAVLPVPAWAMRLMLGEMAEFALQSQRVLPARLLGAGYVFRHPDIAAALQRAVAAESPRR